MVDAFFAADPDAPPLRRGNFMARQRMAVLYDRSVTWGGLVVGTGNKTESLIGYTTLFGDSACAFNPIGDLYKSQVRQVAAAIGVPETIIRKAPSADLWPGQTDEAEAGFSYPVLDRLLFWRIDRRRTDEEMAALGFDPALVDRVDRMIATSEFKRQVPPIAKLGPRTAGVDYLYPRRRPGSARAGDATRPRRPRGGRLYVVATPIGNLADVTLRALEVLRAVAADRGRGHPPDAAAARAPRDRDADGQLPRPERAGPARELLDAPPGRRGPRARHRRRDARRQRPRRRARRGVGGEGGVVVPIPGASAVLAAVAASGVAGPRWSFEGFLPRSGRERRERLARIAADERGTVLYEAPGRVAATLPTWRRRAATERPAAVCRELTKLHEEIVRGHARRAGASGHGTGS